MMHSGPSLCDEGEVDVLAREMTRLLSVEARIHHPDDCAAFLI